MIPKNIGKEHVIKTIDEIERMGFPKNRSSQKYFLKHIGGYYSPKYVVCLANKYVNGKMLEPFQLEAGSETNGFLQRSGFEIVGAAAPERPIATDTDA